MSKAKAIFQILLGLLLSYAGFPTQSSILINICQQEAIIGWLSASLCLFFKYILLILGLISLIVGVFGLMLTEKKK